MPEREKVIKALDCCLDIVRSGRWASGCLACPYAVEQSSCREKMILDAIALLKEQEAEWIEYPECLKYEGALDDSYIVCSRCEHVFNIIDNCTEEFDYCPHCGAKMTDRR